MAGQARILDFGEARAAASTRTSSSRKNSARSRSTRNTRGGNVARSSASSRATSSARNSNAKRSTASGRTASSSARKSSTTRNSQPLRQSRNSQKLSQASRAQNSKRSSSRANSKKTAARSINLPNIQLPQLPQFNIKLPQLPIAATKTGLQLGSLSLGRKSSIALIVCACLIMSCILMYAPMKNYYTAVRDRAKAEVALEIVTTRNAALLEDVALLTTDEGMEDRARDQYGWVKQGENAVAVAGLSEGGEPSAAEILRTVTLNDVKAPETWYSPMLDSVFGYSNE